MGSENTTAADYDTLDAVREEFNDLAAAFRNGRAPLGTHHDETMAASGRFRTDLEDGAIAFLLSWREVFEVCEEAAGLIAGNVGKTVVDLKSVDVDADTGIDLGPR